MLIYSSAIALLYLIEKVLNKEYFPNEANKAHSANRIISTSSKPMKKNINFKYFLDYDEKIVLETVDEILTKKGTSILSEDTAIKYEGKEADSSLFYSLQVIKKNLRGDGKEISKPPFLTGITSQIAFMSVTYNNFEFFLNVDFKNYADIISHSQIFQVPFNSSYIGDPFTLDTIKTKNCSRSEYVPSLKILVTICSDGFRIYLVRHLIKSNLREMTLLESIRKNKLIQPLNFAFVTLPTNDPEYIQILAFRYGTRTIHHIVTNKYTTKFETKVSFMKSLSNINYIGNLIILFEVTNYLDGKPNYELYFKENLFGANFDLSNVKYFTGEGRYANSFYSENFNALIVELYKINRRTLKDEAKEKRTVEDYEIFSYKYESRFKSFSVLSRWNSYLGGDVRSSKILKIRRNNNFGFVFTYTQREKVPLNVNSSDEATKQIINEKSESTSDYSFTFNRETSSSRDSTPEKIIANSDQNFYLDLYLDPTYEVGEDEKKANPKQIVMHRLQRPYCLIGYNLPTEEINGDIRYGKRDDNVSIWVLHIKKSLENQAIKNHTFYFSNLKRPNYTNIFLTEDEILENSIKELFVGLKTYVNVRYFFRGNLLMRIADEKDTHHTSREIRDETDYKLIENEMELSLYQSISFRFDLKTNKKLDNFFVLMDNDNSETKIVVFQKYQQDIKPNIFQLGKDSSMVWKGQLGNEGKIIKVLPVLENSYLLLKEGGGIYIFDIVALNERELNFPGKPCMDILVFQPTKLKETLVCLENDLTISLYYIDELIGGWSSLSRVKISKQDVINSRRILKVEDVKMMHTKRSPNNLYFFVKTSGDNWGLEENFFIYNLDVTYEIKLNIISSQIIKPGKKIEKHKIYDIEIMDTYLVMLLRDEGGEWWFINKLIYMEKNYSLINLKEYKIPSEIELIEFSPKLRLMHSIGKLKRFSNFDSAVFGVSVKIKDEYNMLIMSPLSSKIETLLTLLLPHSDKERITIFNIYSNTLASTFSSIGIHRCEFFYLNRRNKTVPALNHIFLPSYPAISIDSEDVVKPQRIFLEHVSNNIEKKVYITNGLHKVMSDVDRQVLVKQFKFSFVQSYKEFFLRDGNNQYKKGSGLSGDNRKIEMKKFFNEISTKLKTRVLRYNISIDDLVIGNIFSMDFDIESALEKAVGQVTLNQPIINGTEIDIKNLIKDEIQRPNSRVQMICLQGYIKKYTASFEWICEDYALVYHNNYQFILFKEQNNKNNDYQIMSNIRFNDFQNCNQGMFYRNFYVTVCSNENSNFLLYYDLVNHFQGKRDVQEYLIGKVNQFTINIYKNYLTISSFSIISRRYVRLIVFELVSDTSTKMKRRYTSLGATIDIHYVKTISINCISYDVVVHRNFKSNYRASDDIIVFSVDCDPGAKCKLQREAFFTKELGSQTNIETNRNPEPIEFRLSVKPDKIKTLMSNPRITAMYKSDMYYFYIYVHLPNANDYIFRIGHKNKDFKLREANVFKISNPFFGMMTIKSTKPKCIAWVCVVLSHYNEKTYVRFYNVYKNTLTQNRPLYKNAAKRDKNRDEDLISNLVDKESIFTFNVIEFGDITSIEYDFRRRVGSSQLPFFFLKKSQKIKVINISQKISLEFNNLYLSSRKLKLHLTGVQNRKITLEYDIIPYYERDIRKYYFRIIWIILVALIVIVLIYFGLKRQILIDTRQKNKFNAGKNNIKKILKLVKSDKSRNVKDRITELKIQMSEKRLTQDELSSFYNRLLPKEEEAQTKG